MADVSPWATAMADQIASAVSQTVAEVTDPVSVLIGHLSGSEGLAVIEGTDYRVEAKMVPGGVANADAVSVKVDVLLPVVYLRPITVRYVDGDGEASPT